MTEEPGKVLLSVGGFAERAGVLPGRYCRSETN
jgi:hypothetical protein